jgi:predicted amidophosphoribosyltransferase
LQISNDDWQCALKQRSVEIERNGKQQGIYNLIQKPYCEKCSSNGKSTELCGWHSRFHPALTRVYAMGIYFPDRKSLIKNDMLSQHLWWLKFKSAEWSTPIGTAMSLVLRRLYSELANYDLLVPIPFFPRSTPTKEYDHAEELAKVLSHLLGKPWKQMLSKTRDEKLVGKTIDERWASSKDLFAMARDVDVEGKSILLIDDICTTGSSLSRSAGILSEQGKARRVAAFVAGRDYDRAYPIAET